MNETFETSYLLIGLSKFGQTFAVRFLKSPSIHPICINAWGSFSFEVRNDKSNRTKDQETDDFDSSSKSQDVIGMKIYKVIRLIHSDMITGVHQKYRNLFLGMTK